MADVLGEEDLFCDDDCMSDFRTVSGRTALAQSLYRRWTTDQGTLIGDPNYGKNLTNYINDDVTTAEIGQIVAIAVAEAKQDERVVDITGEGRLAEDGTLYLTFEVIDGQGPFTLTIAVSAVTVTLLTVDP